MKILKSLLLIAVVLFFSACSNNEEFEHKKVSYETSLGYKLEFTVKNVEFKEYVESEIAYDGVDFEVEIKNLMTKPQAPFNINVNDFEFYFINPQSVKKVFMYEINSSMKTDNVSISAEETIVIHYRVLFNTINKNKDYVLKLCDTRI